MLFDQDGLESFPLAAVRVAQGGKPVERPEGDSAHIDFPGGLGTVRKIPLQRACYDGTFPKSAVRGKIVVVGSTATSLQDFHRTSTSGDSTDGRRRDPGRRDPDRRSTASRCARPRGG